MIGILFQMNKVYGWEPEPFYNVTEVQNHPTMPSWLKAKIGKAMMHPNSSILFEIGSLSKREFGPKIAAAREKRSRRSVRSCE